MSNQMNLPDTTNAISSPGSADGATPCGSPESATTNQSGREAAHASRLASLVKEWERMTKDTCGLISETSSASASLQSSLESRLRARLDVNGSMEYRLTWKHWLIGSRRQICALLASAHRIPGRDCSSLPTPTAMEWKDSGYEPELLARLDRGGRIARWICSRLTDLPKVRVGLNHSFARWMMGFPQVWDSCGATAMQSCRNSRRNLSGRQSKP